LLSRAAQGRLRLLMHGSIIIVIGLLSGFGFLFVILDSVSVWPVVIELDAAFPGSERGWRLAHVAGISNGLMMIVAGLTLVHIEATKRAQAWIVWGMIYTGWANTIFFHMGNFSSNRALSAGTSNLGEADLLGAVGYVIGASTIPFTLIAMALIGYSSFRLLQQNRFTQ
jgi:hypothetical protein